MSSNHFCFQREKLTNLLFAKEAWKVRHITQNPHVSLTIPMHKRISFMPWIKIPAATITFSGSARIFEIVLDGIEKDSTRSILLNLNAKAKRPYIWQGRMTYSHEFIGKMGIAPQTNFRQKDSTNSDHKYSVNRFTILWKRKLCDVY